MLRTILFSRKETGVHIRLKKLSGKLVISLSVIQIVAGSAAGYLHMKSQEREMLHQIKIGADQLSGSIAAATWHAMLAARMEDAYQTMELIAHKQGIAGVRMFNKEGIVTFSTSRGDSGRVGKEDPSCAVCHSSREPLVRAEMNSRARLYTTPAGVRNLAMVTPIYNEPSCSDADCHAHPASVKVLGVLEVAYDLQSVDAQMAGIRTRVELITFTLIVILGLFILIFSKRFIDVPIRQLIAGVKSVSAMDLDKPVRVKAGLEIAELARAFDTMRVRLKDALEENARFTQSLETKVAERTEQLRVAHQKLIHSYRLASLGQLSASVAHEINNPVSGVLNLAMLMQRILTDAGVPPERVPDFKKYLSQIVHETSRVGRIVQDLLAFSRRSAPHRSPADINLLVKRTTTVLGHKIALMNVKLESDLAENLPTVQCDGSQIQQVLFNLIINAAESTSHRPGGWVRVRSRAGEGGSTVVVTVEDNGEGIRQEHLTKSFDPFFTTKPEGKGVGLGLAVVYGIVESHNGDIDVQSMPGKGSTFIVTLPVAATPAPVPPSAVP